MGEAAGIVAQHSCPECEDYHQMDHEAPEDEDEIDDDATTP